MKSSKLLALLGLVALVAFALGYGLSPRLGRVANDGTSPIGEKTTWTFQMYGSAAQPTFAMYQNWAADVYAASRGRLHIAIHPVGTVVPLLESLATVQKGVLDGALLWGPFWRGQDSALALACGQTAGLTADEFNTWLHSRGGLALLQEAYGRHNVHYLPAIAWPAETFLWSSRPITTLADLQGLKVRAAGFSLDTFTRLGAVATFIPGGETPSALLKRTVDAAEFGNLVQDMAIGFHEAANFAMVGPRAPVVYSDLLINRDRWNALSPDLQSIVTNSILAHGIKGHQQLLRLDAEALETAKARGVRFIPVSTELAVAFRQAKDALLDEAGSRNPQFASIWASQREFRAAHRTLVATLYP